MGLELGGDLGAKEGFAGVDISDTGDDFLVEECVFDLEFTVGEGVVEDFSGEVGVEGFWPERLEAWILREVLLMDDIPGSEAARIAVSESIFGMGFGAGVWCFGCVFCEDEDDVFVFMTLGVWFLVLGVGGGEEELPAHTEMADEDVLI